jgi:cobalt/nickel transport protein
MPRKLALRWLSALALYLAAQPAPAHFQVLVPSRDVISSGDSRTVDLKIVFTHPMQDGPAMAMGPPRRFGVLARGAKSDLRDALKPVAVDGKAAFTASVRLARPGDHVFYLEPAPYWEPSEGKMIVHYTKVVVDFMGLEDGWDTTVGFPVEIEPLVRPYGLWTGNQFRGIVTRDGKPVPFAEVEVEFLNEGRRVPIPNDAFVTQVIKADASGVFSYTMPKAGWWGFAALVDGDEKLENPQGEAVDVELGGLIWVKTVDME